MDDSQIATEIAVHIHVYQLSPGLDNVTGVCKLCGEAMPDWKASNMDRYAATARKPDVGGKGRGMALAFGLGKR